MSNNKLSDSEVSEALENLSIWGVETDRLVTKIEFNDYKEAVFFANTVFSIAETRFHHPEVKVEYGAVSIDLWSHEAEGITQKDIDMAEEIEDKVADIKWS
jgi:4a-hydroxytetrahydrobiopterin dehydratase